MSTAVLMTDSWKPSVLHISPFSNNGKPNLKGYQPPLSNNNRNFPVLAVTRTNSADAMTKQNKSDSASRHHPKDSRSNDKTTSGRLPKTFVKKRAKSYPNTETPNQDRLVTFQDFDDRVGNDISSRTTSAASVDTRFSSVSASLSEPPSNKYLPKPTFSDRGRYFGQNVIKRTTTLTPGEAELQKHRENYVLEQTQKKSKYKLNVNELPRSTTPINDNDPDKLNMKQVIQFLQNKKSTKPQQESKMSSGRRYISTTAKFHQRHSEDITVKQRPWSDIPGQNSNTYILDNRTNSNNESVSSTRSSPDVRQKSAASRKSTRSMSEKGHKDKRSKIELKAFKLYRFLAFAPGENEQSNDSSSNVDTQFFSKTSGNAVVTTKVTKVEKKCFSDPVKCQSSRIFHNKHKVHHGSNQPEAHTERQNIPTTANLMHRRARERQRKAENEMGPTQNVTQNVSPVSRKSSTGAIRLPSMQDFFDDKGENVAEEQIPNGCDKFTIPIVCITPPMDSENETQFPSMNSDKMFQHTQKISMPKFLLPESKVESKKVFVSLPKEMDNSPVKLMLRQEKNVTREQSYMYELQSARSPNTDYPFPKDNLSNSPPDTKVGRVTIPMSTVAIRQDVIDIEDEQIPDSDTHAN